MIAVTRSRRVFSRVCHRHRHRHVAVISRDAKIRAYKLPGGGSSPISSENRMENGLFMGQRVRAVNRSPVSGNNSSANSEPEGLSTGISPLITPIRTTRE